MSLLSVSSISNPSAPQANISLNADGSVTLPVYTGSSAPLLFQAGTLWYNTTGPALQIRNPANTSWVSLTPPVAATLTEAAAGTLNTVYSSPLTSVPKDASGMTGAALLPTGTNLQRAAIATPVAGMTRFNTDYTPDSLEVYDGTNWNQVAYVPKLGTLPDLNITTNQTLPSAGSYENITIAAGVTATVPSTCSLYARTSITINGAIVGDGLGLPGGIGQGVSSTGPLASVGTVIGQGLGSTGRAYGFATSYMGSSGSSGYATTTGAGTSVASGSGGDAGGTVILKCGGNITVSATGSISCKGAAAANGSISGVPTAWSIIGAGGGSGGLIVLQAAQTLTLAAGATLSVNGGNGGAGACGGSTPVAAGGPGGGGGVIVLNASTLADSSTKNLNGGTGGAGFGAGTALTTFGAGFGGAVTGNNTLVFNGPNGGAGVTFTNVII